MPKRISTVKGKNPIVKRNAPKPDPSKVGPDTKGTRTTPDKWMKMTPPALRPIRMSGNLRNKR